MNRILVFGLTAVICLLFSNLFPYVNLAVQGQEREVTLLQTVQVLFELKENTLAAFMAVVIIGLPIFFVAVLSWLAVSIKLRKVSPRAINLLMIVGYLRFWNMAEIFFLGILISMVKVSSEIHVEIGVSFWAYALFNFFLIAALANVDKFQLARSIKRIVQQNQGLQHAA